MKTLILKDTKIVLAQMKSVEDQFQAFIIKHTLIKSTYVHEDRDFSTYEKAASPDGDEHLTDKYLRNLIGEVYKKHGDSIDHVVVYIHRDNWTLAGIWGTNYSNIYNGYQVHICRFDNRNLANSFGTRYHEFMHSPDAFIKTYTGVDINTLGIVSLWDKFAVHGGRPNAEGTTKWKYIRYQENTDALAAIAPHLRKAYEKRHALNVSQQKEIIGVLERYIILLRKSLIKRSTVKK